MSDKAAVMSKQCVALLRLKKKTSFKTFLYSRLVFERDFREPNGTALILAIGDMVRRKFDNKNKFTRPPFRHLLQLNGI